MLLFRYENNKNIVWLTPLCVKSMMQACLVKGRNQEWLQNNYEDLQPFYEQARTTFFQNKITDALVEYPFISFNRNLKPFSPISDLQ